MNGILKIDKEFIETKNKAGGGIILPSYATVKAEHIQDLINQLEDSYKYWVNNLKFNIKPIIHLQYIKIIAKTNRVTRMFSFERGLDTDDLIIGARFTNEGKKKHIISYSVSLENIQSTINELKDLLNFVNKEHEGFINKQKFDNISKEHNNFKALLRDCYFAEKVVDRNNHNIQDKQLLISFYNVGEQTSIENILGEIGIEHINRKKLQDNTFLFDERDVEIINNEIPFLVVMSTSNILELDLPQLDEQYNLPEKFKIEDPKDDDQSYVGVIDTPFDDFVFFKNWVESHEDIDPNIKITYNDRKHGTNVSSIIVAGHIINPALDDGCGFFRVKHFGIFAGERDTSFNVLKKIERIVKENTDIKVWNLSLGSIREIQENYISPEAAFLDKIQYENDVIFVISATNDNEKTKSKRIGAPADSINGLVVASHTKSEPPDYARKGPVLSFFVKPDVSYEERTRVCNGNGEQNVSGTSYSTPWITRKIAYLIYRKKFSKELAKALIIHSADNLLVDDEDKPFIGHGIVPKRIEDILYTPDNSFSFYIEKPISLYESREFNIPIPSNDNKYFYDVKGTLCYTTVCSRNKGVDYTNFELDFYLGSVEEYKGNERVVSINDNSQVDYIGWSTEEEARKLFRKWDNVKTIKNFIGKPIKKYEHYDWGIKVVFKKRNSKYNPPQLNYAAVFTFKNFINENRYEEFIKMCQIKGWKVQRLDVENIVENIVKVNIDKDD